MPFFVPARGARTGCLDPVPTEDAAPASSLIHACTVDVEDYFHVSAFENVVDRKDWDSFKVRVIESTQTILEVLQRRSVRATFFVLGWVADRFPWLVREIQRDGHEIGCHSYEHRLIYQLSVEDFRKDLQRAKNAIEQITGEPVTAYRSPSFSITRRSLAALEVLVQEGIRVDSSIYPVVHDRYGIPDAPLEPHRIATPSGELLEFPPTVYQFCGMRLPVAGGGYFRLYPYRFTSHCVRSIAASNRPVNVYVHPWEFDPEQPRMGGLSRLSRFRHYVNLKSNQAKFDRLLREHRFGTMTDALAAYGDRMKTVQCAVASDDAMAEKVWSLHPGGTHSPKIIKPAPVKHRGATGKSQPVHR